MTNFCMIIVFKQHIPLLIIAWRGKVSIVVVDITYIDAVPLNKESMYVTIYIYGRMILTTTIAVGIYIQGDFIPIVMGQY